MIKRFSAMLMSLMLLLGCSPASSGKEMKSMDLYLGNSDYAELVDFLYDYAGKNRLTVLWFGWYKVDNAKHWYERSDKDSNFKIKLELLTEENGSLFFSSHFDESIANVVIDYGDKKAVWLETIEAFKQSLADRGWRLEELK